MTEIKERFDVLVAEYKDFRTKHDLLDKHMDSLKSSLDDIPRGKDFEEYQKRFSGLYQEVFRSGESSIRAYKLSSSRRMSSPYEWRTPPSIPWRTFEST